jgi:hypothetical protein
MKIFFLSSLVFLFLVPGAWAMRIHGQIDSVDFGKKNQEHLMKLDDGRVIFVRPGSHLLSEKTDYTGVPVELEIDSKQNLLSISTLPDESVNPEEERTSERQTLSQTDLPSEEEAARIFRGMNRSYYSKSECTDRAQVWTYEEMKKNNLVSRKVFLFFTNTYIRRYHYNWWFHVSPYVLVQGTERVMDRRYTSGPRDMKNWTDIFIHSKQTCPEGTYRYYRSHRNGAGHCVIVKADMYYRLPYHVRMLEDYGRVKSSFSRSEVNFSYRAFRRRTGK